MRLRSLLTLALITGGCAEGARPLDPSAPLEPVPSAAPLVLPHASGLCAATSLADAAPADREHARAAAGACLEETFGADGCPEERLTRRFDAADRLIEERYDILEPRVRERPVYMIAQSFVRTWTLDTNGDLLRSEDRGEQGLVVVEETRDANRRLTERRTTSSGTPFSDGVTIERWSHHVSGAVVLETVEDENYRTAIERAVDVAGHIVREEHRTNGALDRAIVWTFDGDRELVREEQDGRRRAILRIEHRFGESGREVETVTQRFDGGWIDRQFFDDDGHQVRMEEDTNLDGIADYVVETRWVNGAMVFNETRYDETRDTTEWSYDARGRMIREDAFPSWDERRLRRTDVAWTDEGMARVVTLTAGARTVQETRYDAQDREIEVRRDDQVERRVFVGPLLLEESREANGRIDQRTVHDFDRGNNEIRQATDTDGDGTADARIERRFLCL